MRPITAFALSTCTWSLLVLAAPTVHAQITAQIDANLHHSFIVGNTTLPPGRYVFHMLSQSDLQIMTVSSAAGGASAEFLVRTSDDSHTPRHSELVFNRYGTKEFLTHIYQAGSKVGVTIDDASREEGRLKKQGQNPTPHTEEQEK